MSHSLDRSIWHALSTRQARFAQGNESALRYGTEYAPFAATADESAQSLAALHEIIPPDGKVALFTNEPLKFPDTLVCFRRAQLAQMVLGTRPAPDAGRALPSTTRRLHADDVPAMMGLVALTQPGPFAERTFELGRYLGVFVDDVLVAMAGERMCLEGFVEISAVCTHPDHKGQGLAGALITMLARAAFERNETPFLHVFADNEVALSVYRKLGFSARAMMHLTVAGRADGSNP